MGWAILFNGLWENGLILIWPVIPLFVLTWPNSFSYQADPSRVLGCYT